jgi:hypothetical protein
MVLVYKNKAYKAFKYRGNYNRLEFHEEWKVSGRQADFFHKFAAKSIGK